jgi:hypothetical protein
MKSATASSIIADVVRALRCKLPRSGADPERDILIIVPQYSRQNCEASRLTAVDCAAQLCCTPTAPAWVKRPNHHL